MNGCGVLHLCPVIRFALLSVFAAAATAQSDQVANDGRAYGHGISPSVQAGRIDNGNSMLDASANKQRIAVLLLQMANTKRAAQFREYLNELSRIDELQNQAFSIKGGAAVVGDEYYILVNGARNRLLDGRTNTEWSGKKREASELIFYNNGRARFTPRSVDELQDAWAFVFDDERVYYLNLKQDAFGYYLRDSRRRRSGSSAANR